MLKKILKARKGTLLLLALALGVMLYAYLSIGAVGNSFQRVYQAPASKPAEGSQGGGGETPMAGANGSAPELVNTGLRDARGAAGEVTKTLEGACEKTTLYAVGQPATVSVEDAAGASTSASARLLGVEQSYYGLNPLSLTCGRLIYPDEFEKGERVVVLDEQLAVELFKYAEPLNEEIVLAGQVYRVIGVARARKQVGDEMEYALYVPYRALEKSGAALTLLVYEAAPVKGAGGWAAFESATANLGASGTTISLRKEAMNAAMPLRMLVILCGVAVILYLLRRLNRVFGRVTRRYREKLLTEYAAHLFWWAGWRGLLLAIGYAICAFLLAQFFILLVEPVYTFPEWVPTILVEPKDIQAAFWNVWQKPASALEYRTPELLRLRFFRELMSWSAGAAALLIGSFWGAIKSLWKDAGNGGDEEDKEIEGNGEDAGDERRR